MSTFRGESELPTLIYTGAEAEIWLQEWFGELAIRKQRIPKSYRVPVLDDNIRHLRTSHEATMLREARKLGVAVPTVQHIDQDSSSLIMDYIGGKTLKEELHVVAKSARRARCKALGELLAIMHSGGIVHGDITLSNVISQSGKLFIIDFGLGGFSKEVEAMGVDLLLLNRSIRSTHYLFYTELFKSFIEGYSRIVGPRSAAEIVEKMREVERRGRYFERG
jgi:N6-L-threonylcarbamoyladenine synthase/protein kinase Bud32